VLENNLTRETMDTKIIMAGIGLLVLFFFWDGLKEMLIPILALAVIYTLGKILLHF